MIPEILDPLALSTDQVANLLERHYIAALESTRVNIPVNPPAWGYRQAKTMLGTQAGLMKNSLVLYEGGYYLYMFAMSF